MADDQSLDSDDASWAQALLSSGALSKRKASMFIPKKIPSKNAKLSESSPPYSAKNVSPKCD